MKLIHSWEARRKEDSMYPWPEMRPSVPSWPYPFPRCDQMGPNGGNPDGIRSDAVDDGPDYR
jgi:hypothetical protein